MRAPLHRHYVLSRALWEKSIQTSNDAVWVWGAQHLEMQDFLALCISLLCLSYYSSYLTKPFVVGLSSLRSRKSPTPVPCSLTLISTTATLPHHSAGRVVFSLRSFKPVHPKDFRNSLKWNTEVRKTDFWFTQMRKWRWLLPESVCYKEERKKKNPNDNLVVEFLSVIQESLWKHCKLCLYSLAIGSYKLLKTADSDGLMSENCLAMEHFSVIFLRLYKHTAKLWSSVFIRSQKVLKWPAQFPEAKAFSLVINFISWLSFSD